MESSGRNAKDEYNQQRIDGAVFVDVDELSDQNSSLPHMLPSERHFSEHIGKVLVCDTVIHSGQFHTFQGLCFLTKSWHSAANNLFGWGSSYNTDLKLVWEQMTLLCSHSVGARNEWRILASLVNEVLQPKASTSLCKLLREMD